MSMCAPRRSRLCTPDLPCGALSQTMFRRVDGARPRPLAVQAVAWRVLVVQDGAEPGFSVDPRCVLGPHLRKVCTG